MMEEGYPNLEKEFPETWRDSLLKSSLENLECHPSNELFIVESTKFVAHLHNQHATVYTNKRSKNLYPFQLFYSKNKWYLWDISNSLDSLFIGLEVLRINHTSMKDLENKMIAYCFEENLINQQKEIQARQFFRIPHYLIDMGLCNSPSDTLSLILEGNNQVKLMAEPYKKIKLHNPKYPNNSITSYSGKTYSFKTFRENDYAYLQYNACHDSLDILEGMKDYVKPWLRPIAERYLKNQFQKKEPSKLLATYYNKEFPVFQDFLQVMIDSVNGLGINNLVIDLRRNPGGNTTLGIQLLYHISDTSRILDFKEYAYTSEVYKYYFSKEYEKLENLQAMPNEPELILLNKTQNALEKVQDSTSIYYVPKTRPVFKGNVYILANYNTESAASMLTTLAQDNGLAKIIGTNVGNNPIGATTWTPFKLPKTSMEASISCTYMIRPNPQKGKLQIPDYWAEFSFEDIRNGGDPYLEEVLNQIAAQKTSK